MLIQRRTKPTHQLRIAVLVPGARFVPTPSMSPLKIAFMQGRDVKRRGRSEADNPYGDKLAPNNGQLSAEWLKGFGS